MADERVAKASAAASAAASSSAAAAKDAMSSLSKGMGGLFGKRK